MGESMKIFEKVTVILSVDPDDPPHAPIDQLQDLVMCYNTGLEIVDVLEVVPMKLEET